MRISVLCPSSTRETAQDVPAANGGSSDQTGILLAFFLTALFVVLVVVATVGWFVWRDHKVAATQQSLAKAPAEPGVVVEASSPVTIDDVTSV